MSEKVTGYSLIGVGIVIILLSLVFAWSVFSGRTKPPQLFNLQGVGFDLTDLVGGGLPLPSRGGTKTEILPGEAISGPLNLMAYLLFMGFVATVGAKIAGIGTQLVRVIKVEVKGS